MMEKPKYRFYVLVHSHLSTMQKGVQSAHVVAEMMRLYILSVLGRSNGRYGKDRRNMVCQWANVDKTLIILDGGNSDDLYKFADFLTYTNCKFPHALFFEDQETLCGMLTAVGIIIPESYLKEQAEKVLYVQDTVEDLYLRLIEKPLAR